MARIRVKALWFQPEVGLHGYIGAILEDGTPVALCSREKWDLGNNDSLRKGWSDGRRLFPRGKSVYIDVSERELRADGLLEGSALALTSPF